ncbi:PEP/pyruvate-binding domain-containing protein [Desulfonatronum thioautotrophicum]|uniref:PEP/pyruvate-binding domain-containing protein n=1 Tax=Desulfonatronum thioautotrophicum TaxID=617001 RepID=UPI0005EBCF13|nr:PEP/pyruvate-binding domain-containing protein [Desulfonatronum thioautotrophicum]
MAGHLLSAEASRHVKVFLENNSEALDAKAELEAAYRSGRSLSAAQIQSVLGRLLGSVKSMVTSMQSLGGEQYAALERVVTRIAAEALAELRPMTESRKELVLPLTEITPEMVTFVGAKATNLGILTNQLGIPVPPGFVVTAEGFRTFLQETNLQEMINQELDELHPDTRESLDAVSKKLQQNVLQTEIPRALHEAIFAAYAHLKEQVGNNFSVAVRSSSVGEDGEISFAGQYTSVLGVDKAGLLKAYQRVVASRYSARVLSYRMQHGLTDEETPMAVVVLPMVDALASGVLYSMDPSGMSTDELTVSAVWGLGEALVGGEQSPDVYRFQKETHAILDRDIAHKQTMLVLDAQEGTRTKDVPIDRQNAPVLDDRQIVKLARYGLQLEEYYQNHQDIEWAIDQQGRIRILQSRPLKVVAQSTRKHAEIDASRHPKLLSAGKTASPGLAAGKAFVVTSDPAEIPQGAILVARTTSPKFARYMPNVQGLITDKGAVGSHLASVAREFGIPAIVDAKEATSRIDQDMEITMDAGTTTVYRGRIQEWLGQAPAHSRQAMPGPMHRRLGAIIEKISPLYLTDQASETFTPKHCRTIHDVLRYLHEQSIRPMLSLSGARQDQQHSFVELTTDIPVSILIIDLGGGLEAGEAHSDPVLLKQIRSMPFQAFWRGLTHPDVNWSTSLDLDLLNPDGTTASGGPDVMQQGREQHSYALIARNYLHLNAKFDFHYVSLDVLCSDEGAGNHVTFQYSGGAGGYYGKTLRTLFLVNILQKLEFQTEAKGEFLSASLHGDDAPLVLEKLDQLGRLLACSRFLDVALKDENDVDRLTKMFFNGDYEVLTEIGQDKVTGFAFLEGHWNELEEDEKRILCQNGAELLTPATSGPVCLLDTDVGSSALSLLESIKANAYYPLAIAKKSQVAAGSISVKARCESGCVDMAAGLVFGLTNVENYLVFRIDALKGNGALFRFFNGALREMAKTELVLEPWQWYDLSIAIQGKVIRACLDNNVVLKIQVEGAVQGLCGLWSKADATVSFKEMVLQDARGKRMVLL